LYREHGDAQFIERLRKAESYDFVYSSNCLEHMESPHVALKNWYSLVKPGGYLVITVPDEDLYEQGHWPSKYSNGHKWTFTMFKGESWSHRSLNVMDFGRVLPRCKFKSIFLTDTNYDYSKKNIDQTRGTAECFIEVVIQKPLHD